MVVFSQRSQVCNRTAGRARPPLRDIARASRRPEHRRMPKRPQPDPIDSATSSTEVDLLLSDLGDIPDVADATIAGRVVLVVDSAPIARKFLVQRLEALGYEVHSAESGDRALAMVEH